MDERKLTELFESAVRDTPPASFDDRDVAAEAGRITRRRRNALAGGGGIVAVVALAVGLFYGTGGLGHTMGGSAGSAAMAPVQRSDASGTRFNTGPFAQRANGSDFPSTSPMQGGEVTGKVGSGADSTSQGCGPTDRKLAVALANELPSVGAQVTNPAGLACPSGTRSATYSVPGGTVTALLVSPSQLFRLRTGDLTVTQTQAASGTWTVVVLTRPNQDASTMLTVAQHIAAGF